MPILKIPGELWIRIQINFPDPALSFKESFHQKVRKVSKIGSETFFIFFFIGFIKVYLLIFLFIHYINMAYSEFANINIPKATKKFGVKKYVVRICIIGGNSLTKCKKVEDAASNQEAKIAENLLRKC